jgi:hypothetical protein
MSVRVSMASNHGVNDTRERLDASLLGVPVTYKLAAGLDKPVTKVRIVPQLDDRERERFRFIRLHKKSVPLVHEDLGNRPNTRGYDGRAGCERFQRDAPKAFVDASRVDHEIGRRVDVGNGVNETGEYYAPLYRMLPGYPIEFLPIGEVDLA